MFDARRLGEPRARFDRGPLSEHASAMLGAIVGDPDRKPGEPPFDYALWADLRRAGHGRGALAELWLAGLVDVLESEPEGHRLPEGVWITLTVEGACLMGVRIEEDERGRARWVPIDSPETASCQAARMKRCVRLGHIDTRLALMIHRRKAERDKAEERAREMLRQAEADAYLIDPRTGQPASLWGVRLGPKTRRVGVAPKLASKAG